MIRYQKGRDITNSGSIPKNSTVVRFNIETACETEHLESVGEIVF